MAQIGHCIISMEEYIWIYNYMDDLLTLQRSEAIVYDISTLPFFSSATGVVNGISVLLLANGLYILSLVQL